MVIGTASVILVVTISLTARRTSSIRSKASAPICGFAHTKVAAQSSSAEVSADYIKSSDIQAVREQLTAKITAATGIESNYDSMFINAREQRLLVIGSGEYYCKPVRNIVV